MPGLQHAEIGRQTVDDLGPVIAYDAAQDPEACALIWGLLLAGAEASDREAEVSFRRTAVDGLDPSATPVPFTGQQSNTSVMFGDVAMIKFFRRIELGPNLDIEVHDALARGGVDDVARLYGWTRARWLQDGTPVEADLAMAVEKLAAGRGRLGSGPGLAAGRRRLRRGRRPARPGPGRDPRGAPRRLPDRRGRRDRHRGDHERPARPPPPWSRPALNDLTPGLQAAFAKVGDGRLATQRVHGDFHLGQTLKTPQGWKIIDFEGEPAKTMAERLAPDSPWRDVAGMLRSFDYAAATVPGPGAARWLDSAREAFLTAYADGPLTESQLAILQAYVADKAVYELVYEVRNRPDWTAIPLGAIRTLRRPEQRRRTRWHSTPAVS